MKVGIIGAGLIGRKRAGAVAKSDQIIVVADIDISKAENLANELVGCESTGKWTEVVARKDVDAVCVATTHESLAEISLAILTSGKHVLCEKPLGIRTPEVERCVKEAKKKKLIYKTGFNHRFHPGIFRAHEMFKTDKIGELMYIKATYGIGGRPGYEREWRMNKRISGGGELIDQGTHLIDLSRWFMGEIVDFKAELLTCFWPVRVEDNVFMWLKNKKAVAELHASWTEWKNRFVFEVHGTLGYLKINGLGGSYGTETLTWGLRIPGKAPEEKAWAFPGEDVSWKGEWQNFRQAVRGKEELNGSGEDGLEMLRIIEKAYKHKT